jgi:predicted nucleotidyltransferase
VYGIERFPVEEILSIVEEHGGRNPRVFGSRVRGDAPVDSDLDLLIEAGPSMSLLDVAAIQVKAERLLEIPVQVVTEGALHPLPREDILSEAMPLVA